MKCQTYIKGRRCRRRATHDVAFGEVQLRDEDGALLWREDSEPIRVAGAVRVIRGGAYCREDAYAWAANLNERRQRREREFLDRGRRLEEVYRGR